MREGSNEGRDARETARGVEIRKPSREDVDAWTTRTCRADALWLAPLTRGGNYAFRRLCEVDFGARVTVSEMAFARFLGKGNRVERARLRRVRERGDGERTFGAQIATTRSGGRARGVDRERGVWGGFCRFKLWS